MTSQREIHHKIINNSKLGTFEFVTNAHKKRDNSLNVSTSGFVERRSANLMDLMTGSLQVGSGK